MESNWLDRGIIQVKADDGLTRVVSVEVVKRSHILFFFFFLFFIYLAELGLS